MWEKVNEDLPAGSSVGFWGALDVWINKPHVLNRNLCGSCLLIRQHMDSNLCNDEVIASLKSSRMLFTDVQSLSKNIQDCIMRTEDHASTPSSNSTIEICIRDIHPKQLDRYLPQREAIIIDKSSGSVSFLPLLKLKGSDEPELDDSLPYKIHFDESNHRVSLHTIGPGELVRSSGAACSKEWLHGQLLTKLARWSFHENLETEIKSLRLVPLDRYNQRYYDMKSKYGSHLVENWPESTDPQKFVFEDISIAAYLLTLWEEEREEKRLTEKQTFVDLGCGNGLLVHLLSKEGHKGKGIDLRKRNIWDFYGPETCLEEHSFTPSDSNLFSDYDWLIGNHSDELTPWIPVIAARSSYKCSYFVLPCCSFDFDSKFKQKQHGKSQYRCYLDYIKYVGQECGFTVQEDTLRIPSTKRVCFIGNSRTYSPEDEVQTDAHRCDLITSRCSIHGQATTNDALASSHEGAAKDDNWINNFEARNPVEKPRNCLSVDKAITKHVVVTVFEKVLNMDRECTQETSDGRVWHTGGKCPLSEVVKLFDADVMKELKNECGGMQTLLRNHYHIFRVSGGNIEIRDMGEADEQHWKRKQKLKGNKKPEADTRKTRLCYLNSHHPDGCPQSSQNCRFAHGETELRSAPLKDKSQKKH